MKHFLFLLLLFVLSTRGLAEGPTDYARDVKPVLAQKCFACHGALKQQSGLRLDTAAMSKRGGDSGAGVVPGKPAESLIYQRITAGDAAERMPPEGEAEPLDAKQLAALKAWIESGAEAPDETLPPDPREHWAYQTPVRPAVPAVQGSKFKVQSSRFD